MDLEPCIHCGLPFRDSVATFCSDRCYRAHIAHGPRNAYADRCRALLACGRALLASDGITRDGILEALDAGDSASGSIGDGYVEATFPDDVSRPMLATDRAMLFGHRIKRDIPALVGRAPRRRSRARAR